MLIAKNAGAAVVPPALVGITTKAAIAFAAGSAGLAGALSSQVASLAQEVLRTVPLAMGKLAKLLITLALLMLIAIMSGILVYEIAGYQGTLWGCETPAKTDLQK
jgi:hypothetical protein